MAIEEHDACSHRYATDFPPEDLARDRREFPFSTDWNPLFERSTTQTGKVLPHRPPPETEMQALMEALPFQEPDTSKEETLRLREALLEAFETLGPRERWLFEAIHYRGLSMRRAGSEIGLSKTQTHRVFQQATAALRLALADWWAERE